MSFSTVLSAAIEGLAVEAIRVEADVSNGLPVFHMVGYLSSEVKEAGERVRTAIRNTGFEFPAKRVVINLSPATMRKRGASFDLPIAAAILISLGEISKACVKDSLIIGELGLDGRVRKSRGSFLSSWRRRSRAFPAASSQGKMRRRAPWYRGCVL